MDLENQINTTTYCYSKVTNVHLLSGSFYLVLCLFWCFAIEPFITETFTIQSTVLVIEFGIIDILTFILICCAHTDTSISWGYMLWVVKIVTLSICYSKILDSNDLSQNNITSSYIITQFVLVLICICISVIVILYIILGKCIQMYYKCLILI